MVFCVHSTVQVGAVNRTDDNALVGFLLIKKQSEKTEFPIKEIYVVGPTNHTRTCRGGGQLPPTLKIWAKSEFFGKRLEKLGQNQNVRAAKRNCLAKKIFCASKVNTNCRKMLSIFGKDLF